MFILYNNNPSGLKTGDCVIRAITLALDYNWFMVHDELSFLSRQMTDMPSSNRVWKEYLRQKGLREELIQNTCPNCMTVKSFADKHPRGRYILSTCEFTEANQNIYVTSSHVVAVINGNYYDIGDSGGEVPLSYFYVGN